MRAANEVGFELLTREQIGDAAGLPVNGRLRWRAAAIIGGLMGALGVQVFVAVMILALPLSLAVLLSGTALAMFLVREVGSRAAVHLLAAMIWLPLSSMAFLGLVALGVSFVSLASDEPLALRLTSFAGIVGGSAVIAVVALWLAGRVPPRRR